MNEFSARGWREVKALSDSADRMHQIQRMANFLCLYILIIPSGFFLHIFGNFFLNIMVRLSASQQVLRLT